MVKTKEKEAEITRGKRKSLSGELIRNILRLTVIALLCVSLVSGILIYDLALSRMRDSCEIASAAYASAAENGIEKYKSCAESMAMDTRITPGASVEELDAIRNGFKQDYGLGDVFFITGEGHPFDAPSMDLSGRAYFQRAMAGETNISSPVVKTGTEDVVLYVATPINNGTGYQGVLVLQLDLNIFNSVVADVAIGSGGFGFIVDEQGTFVAHQDPTLVSTFTNYITLAQTDANYAEGAETIQQMIERQTGSIVAKDMETGETVYCVYTPVSGTNGWVMGVAANRAEMMSSFTFALIILLALLFGTCVVAVFISVRIAKRLVAPISDVSGHLISLSKGDLEIYSTDPSDIFEINALELATEETIGYLNRYISGIDETLSRISQSDLDFEITEDYVGDFIRIKQSMNLILESLNATMTNIGTVSTKVLTISDQVSSSAQTLAQGATEQASAVSELLATINDISNRVSDTALQAGTASESADDVRAEIAESDDKMHHLLEAMRDISATSHQVDKIVKIIEDIAFQTNILALNAAVEAARAGVSGKGFAVVANEVKSLATKCAEAAEDTTKLIKNTISAVENGMEITSDTAALLTKVVDNVNSMSDTVNAISSASAEESIAIEQVVEGLNQVSAVIQSNSAAAEESAAVSHELADHAHNLEGLVRVFKLKA